MITQNYLIIYSKSDSDPENPYLGMKLFDKNGSKQYMKCVELLENNDSDFEIGENVHYYSLDDFMEIKVSSAELKVLNKIFEIDTTGQIGIFPDAINDAFECGLIDDDEIEE